MPMDLGRPIWVDAAHFDPADQVHHAALDAPGEQVQLQVLVARIMGPAWIPTDRCGRCGRSTAWRVGAGPWSPRHTTRWSTGSRDPIWSSHC
jgi:hypothetical protein